MKKQLVKKSKFLSLVLRHAPERVGLTLDEQGWADVDELLLCAAKNNVNLDREMLQEVVLTNDKKRFSFSEDGNRIRANQGHSIVIDLGLDAVEPPELLYHGTASRFLDSILKRGLVKKNRHHVHLSPDTKTAKLVGQRHGKPAILSIKAAEMHKLGYLFFVSKNGVWLTDHVPTDFITVLPEDDSKAYRP